MSLDEQIIARTLAFIKYESDFVDDGIAFDARMIASALRRAGALPTDRLWEALKQQCAADPARATRLVMVTRSDVDAALASVTLSDRR